MKLIVDCGGTSCDYALISEDGTRFFKGSGFNATTHSNLVFPKEIIEGLHLIEEAHFYIAGYQDNSTFALDFPKHICLTIKNDLTGAARAAFGDSQGIICILGTGSAAAQFENGELVSKIPSLGYLLDNEGGASHLGGLILKYYFSNFMDEESKQLFETEYNLTHGEILNRLYNSEDQAFELAQFSHFLSKCTPTLRKSIFNRSLDDFFKYKIEPLDNWNDYSFYFCGGIAYNYKSDIRDFFRKKGIEISDFVNEPIINLVNYHKD